MELGVPFRRIVDTKRKHHGAVDKRSSEHWFHKSVAITVIVWKTGALAIVEPGLTAGRQAGRQADESVVK